MDMDGEDGNARTKNWIMNTQNHVLQADAFERRGQSWYVSTPYISDLIIEIGDVTFHLHKFAMSSKCGRLSRRTHEASKEGHAQCVRMDDLPGGWESFELAAKFCYGVTIDLNPSNVANLRCAAEFLEMTEEMEEGNLIFKAEAFFSYSVLPSWRDTVLALKTCEELSPWAENLQIVRRCCDSIAWKALTNNNANIYSKQSAPSAPTVDAWVEDVCVLRIDHFARVITALKVKGMAHERIGGAITLYASRTLHEWSNGPTATEAHRVTVESLVSIIPPQRDTVSCSFLLKMLRLSIKLRVSPALVTEIEKRVGMQLDQAELADLLIPSFDSPESVYDVEAMHRVMEHFLIQRQHMHEVTNLNDDNEDMEKVARLVDSYLAEVARDRHLSPTKFQLLAETLPDNARVSHDGLYRAVDSYLKSHPMVSEHERKRLCKVMDCIKLSPEACMHAAQNERLPLRTVVQVLLSQHLKLATSVSGGHVGADNSTALTVVDRSLSPDELYATVKAIKFENEGLRNKVSRLQSDMEGLIQQVECLQLMCKPKNVPPTSAWMSGWKKLGKLRSTSIFHLSNSKSGQISSPSTKPRQWRNSIS